MISVVAGFLREFDFSYASISYLLWYPLLDRLSDRTRAGKILLLVFQLRLRSKNRMSITYARVGYSRSILDCKEVWPDQVMATVGPKVETVPEFRNRIITKYSS